jgi:hypothetical protein
LADEIERKERIAKLKREQRALVEDIAAAEAASEPKAEPDTLWRESGVWLEKTFFGYWSLFGHISGWFLGAFNSLG